VVDKRREGAPPAAGGHTLPVAVHLNGQPTILDVRRRPRFRTLRWQRSGAHCHRIRPTQQLLALDPTAATEEKPSVGREVGRKRVA
jgi:hypothetical protein